MGKKKLSWFVARGELPNYYKIIFFSEEIKPNLMLCLTFISSVMVISVGFCNIGWLIERHIKQLISHRCQQILTKPI